MRSLIRNRWLSVLVLWSMGLALVPAAGLAVPQPSAEATITSDELELRNNGALSIFTGHVKLKQDPYLLLSDRMERTKETGIVVAKGHVHGFWTGDKGEKGQVLADRGRYKPADKIVELWGPSRVKVRWQDSQGKGEFVGDRGWVFLDTRKARLENNVTGHVDPK